MSDQRFEGGRIACQILGIGWLDRWSADLDFESINAHAFYRSARLDWHASRRFDMLDDLSSICGRLASHLHIEIALLDTKSLCSAYHLAHFPKQFILTYPVDVLSRIRSSQPDQWARLLWWLDMGNLHLKLLITPHSDITYEVVSELMQTHSDRIVSGGFCLRSASQRDYLMHQWQPYWTTWTSNAKTLYGFYNDYSK